MTICGPIPLMAISLPGIEEPSAAGLALGVQRPFHKDTDGERPRHGDRLPCDPGVQTRLRIRMQPDADRMSDPGLGRPRFPSRFARSRIASRLTPSSKNATFDCTDIRDNAPVSSRTPFAEQAPPVKRALPVLGLLHAAGDVAAASIVFARSRFAAVAAAFDKLVDRAVMVALLGAPPAAGAATGHWLASAALALAAALALMAARVFPIRARAIEMALSIALAVIALALAGVAAWAIFG